MATPSKAQANAAAISLAKKIGAQRLSAMSPQQLVNAVTAELNSNPKMTPVSDAQFPALMTKAMAGKSAGMGALAGPTVSAAAKGASVGGTIGSAVPVIGTAIGSVVGAIGGVLSGAFGDHKDPGGEQRMAIKKKIVAQLQAQGWWNDPRFTATSAWFRKTLAPKVQDWQKSVDSYSETAWDVMNFSIIAALQQVDAGTYDRNTAVQMVAQVSTQINQTQANTNGVWYKQIVNPVIDYVFATYGKQTSPQVAQPAQVTQAPAQPAQPAQPAPLPAAAVATSSISPAAMTPVSPSAVGLQPALSQSDVQAMINQQLAQQAMSQVPTSQQSVPSNYVDPMLQESTQDSTQAAAATPTAAPASGISKVLPWLVGVGALFSIIK